MCVVGRQVSILDGVNMLGLGWEESLLEDFCFEGWFVDECAYGILEQGKVLTWWPLCILAILQMFWSSMV